MSATSWSTGLVAKSPVRVRSLDGHVRGLPGGARPRHHEHGAARALHELERHVAEDLAGDPAARGRADKDHVGVAAPRRTAGARATTLPERVSAVGLDAVLADARGDLRRALSRALSWYSLRGSGDSASRSTPSTLTTSTEAPVCSASWAAASATQGWSAPALAATTILSMDRYYPGCMRTYVPSARMTIVDLTVPPFKLDSVYSPDRRPAGGDRLARRGHRGGRARAHAAGRHRARARR